MFRVVKRGRNWTKKGILGLDMAEEGGTGAKPARGTRGPRVVTAAREVIAPYRGGSDVVGSDTPLAALLTRPRLLAHPPRPEGSTRSAVERRPYRKNKKQLEQLVKTTLFSKSCFHHTPRLRNSQQRKQSNAAVWKRGAEAAAVAEALSQPSELNHLAV